MKNYSSVKPLKDYDIDSFIADYNLFAVFDAPVNVLFVDNFKKNIKKYKDIFMHFNMPNNIFFSCKCNKGFSFLKYAADNGCGIEVSSVYELSDALKFTNRIIASGPAKSHEYIDMSIKNNVLISVDDIYELQKICETNKEARVFLRIIPLNMISRFGINVSQIDKCLNLIENSNIHLEGFSFHINNYDLNDRVNAINQIISMIHEKNISIKYIDIGGGLPTSYCSKQDYFCFLKNNTKEMYFKNKEINDFYPYYNEISNENALNYILNKVYNLLDGIEIIVEPGRCLLKNCGISIYKVEYLKKFDNGDYIIVTNGNINCLSEQWFNSDYIIEPTLLKRKKGKKLKEPIYASIAGNLCLEQDMITWRKIKFDYLPEPGDYLIYYNTAGYQMDSNESTFHKIPLVKKYVVVKENKRFIIRKDESYDSK